MTAIHPDDWAMLEALRRESDNLDRARAELIGADPGVVNTTVHLQVSDDLLLRIANDMQRRAYDAARAGLPIDEALQRWYFKAECLRTVFADARRRASMERHGLHKPACFDPPADYECHPAAPAPASADPKGLADFRVSLSAALQRYDVDSHSLITSAGKFQGEHIACPIYWDAALSGASSETWSHDSFGCWEWLTVDATDCAMWPDIDMRMSDMIELHEHDNGFVTMTIIPAADIEARRADLDAICYPIEDESDGE